MKNLKTILKEAVGMSDEYEFFADSERTGEISRAIYYRACATGDGMTASEADKVLRENYQRAGLAHLF